MDISAIALGGLEQAQVQLEKAAISLAGAAGSSSSASSDSVDLSAGIVALLSAKNDFAVNISVLKTADQIQKSAIDIMA
jgi:flagellar hook protein FlgE